MNSKIRNIVLFVSTVFVLLSCAGESKTTPNKDKAEEMFQRGLGTLPGSQIRPLL